MNFYDLPDRPEQETRDEEYMKHKLITEEMKKTLVLPKAECPLWPAGIFDVTVSTSCCGRGAELL
jgi:hypothetical protein